MKGEERGSAQPHPVVVNPGKGVESLSSAKLEVEELVNPGKGVESPEELGIWRSLGADESRKGS